MIERGIWDTKADMWAHLFPLEKRLYSYWVQHMRGWLIENRKIKTIGGRSKDEANTVTGQGYLVPQDLGFIQETRVPDRMLDHFPWETGTDREVGMRWGEQIVEWMLATGCWRPAVWRVREIRGRQQQMDLGDLSLEFVSPNVEIKTEMKSGTGNLYVQTAELGHRVHFTASGSVRVTKAKEFGENS